MLFLFKKKQTVFLLKLTQLSAEFYVAATLPTNINRSDYSFALEKLHPGTAGNDKALFQL